MTSPEAGPRLLLLSNSTNFGQAYLDHARGALAELLGGGVRRALFVPYAAVSFSYEEYTERVGRVFEELGYALDPIHRTSPEEVARAEAIVVGGGNTFALLSRLAAAGLLEALRDRVRAGAPYIGWSAGANLACPTVMTTNDMPIAEVPSLRALGLVPFQINPHYTDARPERHQGESREQRIQEFGVLHPERLVVGLREGSALRIEGRRVRLIGPDPLRLFRHGDEPREIGPDEELDFLMA